MLWGLMKVVLVVLASTIFAIYYNKPKQDLLPGTWSFAVLPDNPSCSSELSVAEKALEIVKGPEGIEAKSASGKVYRVTKIDEGYYKLSNREIHLCVEKGQSVVENCVVSQTRTFYFENISTNEALIRFSSVYSSDDKRNNTRSSCSMEWGGIAKRS